MVEQNVRGPRLHHQVLEIALVIFACCAQLLSNCSVVGCEREQHLKKLLHTLFHFKFLHSFNITPHD